jgi:hypothetical protein
MIRKIAWVALTLTLTLFVVGMPAAPVPTTPDAVKLDAATQEKVRKLQMERRDALKTAVDARQQEYEAGRGTQERLLTGSNLLLKVELDLATTAEQRIAAHAALLKNMRKLEELAKARYEAGQLMAADYREAQAARLEAEIGWLKVGGGKEKKEK